MQKKEQALAEIKAKLKEIDNVMVANNVHSAPLNELLNCASVKSFLKNYENVVTTIGLIKCEGLIELLRQFEVLIASIDVYKEIQQDVVAYFSRHFQQSSIQVMNKTKGDMAGHVVFVDGHKYFVKMHAGGVLRADIGNSSAAITIVNAYELFIYKVLENVNLGAPVTIFGHGTSNWYIVSANVKQVKPSWELQSEFILSKEYMGWKDLLQSNVEQFETAAVTYIEAITKIDIVTRLILVSDVLHNTGNYGYDKESGEIIVLDFRINGNMFDSLDIVHSFQTGNGAHGYANCEDVILQYINAKRLPKLRCATASKVLLEMQMLFDQALDKATVYLNNIAPQDHLMFDEFNFANRTKQLKRRYAEVVDLLS